MHLSLHHLVVDIKLAERREARGRVGVEALHTGAVVAQIYKWEARNHARIDQTVHLQHGILSISTEVNRRHHRFFKYFLVMKADDGGNSGPVTHQ